MNRIVWIAVLLLTLPGWCDVRIAPEPPGGWPIAGAVLLSVGALLLGYRFFKRKK